MKNKEYIRPSAVAGRFYPAGAAELAAKVKAYLAPGSHPAIAAVGLMAPHAGYVYSGKTAGKTFASVVVPERVIIMCPNHTGLGTRISVVPHGSFAIPGGQVPIDEELAAAVLDEVRGAKADVDAHRREHAIEVELPFLLARQPRLRIVPMVLSGLSEAEAIELGHALYRATERVDGDVLVVASSDMSHYLPDRTAREVDRVALEPLLAFDAASLYRTVRDNDISMCGYIPATAMLAYAELAGARPPELIDYSTSGDAFGDRSRVVGYAGVVLPR